MRQYEIRFHYLHKLCTLAAAFSVYDTVSCDGNKSWHECGEIDNSKLVWPGPVGHWARSANSLPKFGNEQIELSSS